MLIQYTAVPTTSAHAELAESFGVFSDKTFTVFEGDVPRVPVTYITGESGSGKTSILNCLGGDNLQTPPDDRVVADFDLQLISSFGLGDAALYFTRLRDLSDSQRFRAKVAYTLSKNPRELRVDEFLSTLDRDTARAVAYNLQRECRRRGVRLIVATAHDDLGDWLLPDATLTGTAFPSRWDVSEASNVVERTRFPIKVDTVSAKYYGSSPLGELHYRGHHVGGIKDVLVARFENRDVGVLVGTYRMHDGGRRISRLVVHPTFRGVGIGKRLVQEYLTVHPTADVVAAMASYNPVFERAGMVPNGFSETKPPVKFRNRLAEYGFDTTRWVDRSYCEEFCRNHPDLFSSFEALAGVHVAPGGVRLSKEEVEQKLSSDSLTAGRVLWRLRPHRYARFIGQGS